MTPSKQLRDKVLEIVKKNKDITFDDIITHMMKEVGLKRPVLTKLVDEILDWWEESGKILQMVDRRTRVGIYRMNENARIAMNIVSESMIELEEKDHPMFLTIREKGIKLGDWMMQSYFYYQGNIWMLKSGTATNHGEVEKFRRSSNRSLVKSLEPKLSEVEKMTESDHITESTRHYVYLNIEGSNPHASFKKLAKMFSSLSSWQEAEYKGNNKALITFNAQRYDSKERMKVAEFIKKVRGVKISNEIGEDLDEAVDETSARELQLYIENDRNIYRQRVQPIIKNLSGKMKKGSFDEKLAVKAFMYAVEDGQKAYNKEFGSGSMNLDKATKTMVAERLLDSYRDEMENS